MAAFRERGGNRVQKSGREVFCACGGFVHEVARGRTLLVLADRRKRMDGFISRLTGMRVRSIAGNHRNHVEDGILVVIWGLR